MSGIESTAQLAALIRTALRSGAGGTLVSAKSTSTRPDLRSSAPQESPRHDTPTDREVATNGLDRQLLERIRRLPAGDPLRRKKAFALFLEMTLAKELGDAVAGEQATTRLTDQVIARMESDQELETQLKDAGELLLQLADRTTG